MADAQALPKLRLPPIAAAYAPGLAVTLLATLSAAYVSDHYGAPLTLMCLLFGLALSFLNADPRLAAGLGFASRSFLRWGVVLMAARVTAGQILQLGPAALAAVVATVALTLTTGVLVARRLGFSASFGVLSGGAVAICGASAAMAFASLLGERRAPQAQVTLVLVGISAMSALAMTVYPALAHHLGFSDLQAGYMLGGSIHDVAQAVGAGFAFSPAAGAIATIVKLARVALLAPALMVVSLFIPRREGAKIAPFALPWFVLGFFAVAAVNSFGVIPAVVTQGSVKLGTGLLACAVTATGVRSQMNSLTENGLRPLLAIVAATITALVLSAAAGWLLLR
jgi:uncharacterized integral membrane protein (TIGR00698 family)